MSEPLSEDERALAEENLLAAGVSAEDLPAALTGAGEIASAGPCDDDDREGVPTDAIGEAVEDEEGGDGEPR